MPIQTQRHQLPTRKRHRPTFEGNLKLRPQTPPQYWGRTKGRQLLRLNLKRPRNRQTIRPITPSPRSEYENEQQYQARTVVVANLIARYRGAPSNSVVTRPVRGPQTPTLLGPVSPASHTAASRAPVLQAMLEAGRIAVLGGESNRHLRQEEN